MHTTRRAFIHGIGALATTALLPTFGHARQQQAKTRIASKPLRGGAFMLGDLATGGNILLAPTDSGPVMVDAKHAYLGTDVMSDVFVLFRGKPAMVINTHHHADHTGGNWVFSQIANIVAHKNLNPRIEGNLQRYAQGAASRVTELERAGAPAAEIQNARGISEQLKTLKADMFKARQDLTDGINLLDVGGVAIQCHHYGPGHTDNDVVVFFPKLNILHTGDLLFHNLHPFIDRSAKANTVSWQKVLKEVMKLGDKDTIVIPGHGEVTDMTALPKQIEYFDQLREVVSKAIADGKTREEVVAMKPDVFKHIGFEQIRPITFGGMYDELKEATTVTN